MIQSLLKMCISRFVSILLYQGQKLARRLETSERQVRMTIDVLRGGEE